MRYASQLTEKGVHTLLSWAEASLGKTRALCRFHGRSTEQVRVPRKEQALKLLERGRQAGSNHCLGITSQHPGWVGGQASVSYHTVVLS